VGSGALAALAAMDAARKTATAARRRGRSMAARRGRELRREKD
jgi:hypothetical protein